MTYYILTAASAYTLGFVTGIAIVYRESAAAIAAWKSAYATAMDFAHAAIEGRKR